MKEELQQVAETLAGRLNRSVAIDDPSIALLAYTAHRGETVDQHRVDALLQRKGGDAVVNWVRQHDIAEAEGPVRVPGNESLGVLERICVPIRAEGLLLGYLWLLDPDGNLTEAEEAEAASAAIEASKVLIRERLMGDLKRSRERESLRDLLASDETVREYAAQELAATGQFPTGAGAAVLVVEVRSTGGVDHSSAIEGVLASLGLRRSRLVLTSTSRGGSSGVILAVGFPPPKLDQLQALAQMIRETLLVEVSMPCQVLVGIGPVVDSVKDAHESHRSAQSAIRVAAQVPGTPEVVAWESIGAYQVLIQLPLEQLRRTNAIPEGLLRLMQDPSSAFLVETLEAYLDNAGDVQSTIASLCIHRTTLYYRLEKIQSATGMNLKSGGDRLALHLGLMLARLLGPVHWSE